jgi:ribosomal-protein-alanine N-acetyltransferase
MTIRPYSSSDDQIIIDLFRLNTPKYFAPAEETDLLDYFANYIDHYYVVEIDGKIFGSGGFNISPDDTEGVLSWDIIHPDSQGKGVGTALTKFRIEEIRKLGIQDIRVRTSQHAYRFYEKMGFALREIVKDYWSEGFDMYDMMTDHKTNL